MFIHPTQRFVPPEGMKERCFKSTYSRSTDPYAIDLHHHDFYEIYYFIGGEVEYRVEGKTYQLQPGDLLLINPWEFHQGVVTPGIPYERRVLWIDRTYLAQFNDGDTDLTACFSPAVENRLRPAKAQRATIESLLEQLRIEQSSSDFGNQFYAQGIFLQLMVEINRMARHSVHQRDPIKSGELTSQVIAYISAHYQEPLTLQSLADTFFVSKYYLSHEFSRKAGTSVYRYVLLRRLLAAREMIAAGYSPSEASAQCGFRDYANFYRMFKTEYGVTPREFAEGIHEAQKKSIT